MNFDINLLLVPLLLASGAILLLDYWRRWRRGARAGAGAGAGRTRGGKRGAAAGVGRSSAARGVRGLSKAARGVGGKRGLAGDAESPQDIPWWLDYSRALFPIILLVVVIRSFIVEPYQIPSSSMVPTLVRGDFILVNKFNYGLRLPLSNYEFVSFAKPQRGDVIVFNFPADPGIRYIKRVVGLPGDSITYYNKTLAVNGEAVPRDLLRLRADWQEFSELLNPDKPPHTIRKYHFVPGDDLPQFTWQVPPGHYFVMGDNRDNSNDSRYWGFVPHQYLVGQAFFIWMNWGEANRWPSFSRSGSIL